MASTSIGPHESAVLSLLAKASDGRLTAGDLKKKLKVGSKTGPNAAEADAAVGGLIDQGLVGVTGGSKEGHHPRPNASKAKN